MSVRVSVHVWVQFMCPEVSCTSQIYCTVGVDRTYKDDLSLREQWLYWISKIEAFSELRWLNRTNQ